MRSSLIFFECLDDDDVAWIYHACHKVHYVDKDVLIDAGMVAAEIFILLEGKCRVESVAGQFLDLLSSGDIIGEVSFVDKRKTATRVSAQGGCAVAVIDGEQLREKLQTDVAFCSRFYLAAARVLAYRLRGNLQVAITEEVNVMNSAQEFVGEIDPADLDATAKSGARLAYLMSRFS
ncbi:MAG: cyclic nucleotide-binding domain-containing protein [Betaproteobacteria bacterium]